MHSNQILKMTYIHRKRYKTVDYPRRNKLTLEKSSLKRETKGEKRRLNKLKKKS